MKDLKDHVYSQWIRDIRAWLETQPGVTEGDASPLDGIVRVMKHKDEQLADCRRLLREVLRGRRRFMRDSLGKELYEAVEKAGGVE